jgi:hypothetical protein
MKKRALVAVAAALFSLTSLAAEYLPLREGLEWVMDAHAVDRKGKRFTGTFRRSIDGKTKVGDQEFFITHDWFEHGRPLPLDVVKFTFKDAAALYSVSSTSTNPPHVEVKLPLKVGESWMTRTRRHTVVTNESVTIGSKTYLNCFRIRVVRQDRDLVEDLWEAPDVGLVKSVLKTDAATITLTLREFRDKSRK